MVRVIEIGQQQLDEISEGTRVLVTLKRTAERLMAGDILSLNEINGHGKHTGRFAFCYITDTLDDTRYCNPEYQVLSLRPILLKDEGLPEGSIWRESDGCIYEHEDRTNLLENR